VRRVREPPCWRLESGNLRRFAPQRHAIVSHRRINEVPHLSTRCFRRYLFLVIGKVHCGMYHERFDFSRRHQWIASHVPDHYRNDQGVLAGYEVSDFQGVLSKECFQHEQLAMYCWFIFETGSRPENFIFHHSFPQRSQHLDWAFTGQPNGCIANREIAFMGTEQPHGFQRLAFT
jgi:hypothetical protein